jgi:hypothetical protein
MVLVWYRNGSMVVERVVRTLGSAETKIFLLIIPLLVTRRGHQTRMQADLVAEEELERCCGDAVAAK